MLPSRPFCWVVLFLLWGGAAFSPPSLVGGAFTVPKENHIYFNPMTVSTRPWHPPSRRRGTATPPTRVATSPKRRRERRPSWVALPSPLLLQAAVALSLFPGGATAVSLSFWVVLLSPPPPELCNASFFLNHRIELNGSSHLITFSFAVGRRCRGRHRRALHRHEQLMVRTELVVALHHSTQCPRPVMEETQEAHKMYYGA